MNAHEFKQIRKSLRESQREFGKNVGLSESEVIRIEREDISLNKLMKQSVRNYIKVKKNREAISVIKARRHEAKISIIEFCEGTGMNYEEFKKMEDF